jgi:intraflagellar transport protein 88
MTIVSLFSSTPLNFSFKIISWLGVWYVKREMYEQAIDYFERAAKVQPGEVKWQLMVTSCYRRLGDLYKALDLYQKVRRRKYIELNDRC